MKQTVDPVFSQAEPFFVYITGGLGNKYWGEGDPLQRFLGPRAGRHIHPLGQAASKLKSLAQWGHD